MELKLDIIIPASHTMKFQGINPIMIENMTYKSGIFKWGKVIFIAQLGVPGKTLNDSKYKNKSCLLACIFNN